MAIELPGDYTEVSFTATDDTLVQTKGNVNVLFQTDNSETEWGSLAPDRFLEIPSGVTVYFKASLPVNLATIGF